jgi:predicted acylesterase/phospholipase RssA/CRP-like cAMP-binding protein
MVEVIQHLSFAGLLRVLSSLKQFKELDRVFIRDFSSRARLMFLDGGEYLFSRGDEATAMYIVIAGRLQVVMEFREGKKSVVKELGPGAPAGIISLVAGGPRNADVIATRRTKLAKLNREHFEVLMGRYPGIREKLLEMVFHRLRRSHLAEVMPEYFEEMDEATFDYIESLFQWVHLDRGQTLFKQGDIGDSLYILINGLLHVVDEEAGDDEKVLGTVHRGKVVGELGLLSDERRTASIYAARDSDLVRLSRQSFESISEKYPQVMIAITRILVDRLKNVRQKAPHLNMAINITILPASGDVSTVEFCTDMEQAFSTYGSTLLLTADLVDRRLSQPGISEIPNSDPRSAALRAWLEEMESRHSFVIYAADPGVTPWTRRCMSRADRLILLAQGNGSMRPGIIERVLLKTNNELISPHRTLVLLHTAYTALPSGTAKWLEAHDVHDHYHIRAGRNQDFLRLARILSNRAVGLALGGGAAKGMAHIGVIRALEEAGILIDIVGGASMGSIIGAQYAMGNSHDEMLELCRKLFIDINPFNEYTLPIISLMRGRKLERMGKLAYGDSFIEDLWLSYFCVSSNLTHSQVKIHRRGSLWKAVRTSSSIPGVISPVLDGGEIYVDGGVINNLPGDILRRQAGYVIVVEVSPNLDLQVKTDVVPSPWKILFNRLIPFKQKIQVPNILDIMLSTVLTGSFIAANSVKWDADISLTPPLEKIGFLDFKKMKDIAEIGYRYTMEELEKHYKAGTLPLKE